MLTDGFCVPKHTGKTFCNQTVTTRAKLSSEHSWVQLQERQEVKAGASGFHGFYLKTLNYITFINSNLFHVSGLTTEDSQFELFKFWSEFGLFEGITFPWGVYTKYFEIH